jgi:hypothetical protein
VAELRELLESLQKPVLDELADLRRSLSRGPPESHPAAPLRADGHAGRSAGAGEGGGGEEGRKDGSMFCTGALLGSGGAEHRSEGGQRDARALPAGSGFAARGELIDTVPDDDDKGRRGQEGGRAERTKAQMARRYEGPWGRTRRMGDGRLWHALCGCVKPGGRGRA